MELKSVASTKGESKAESAARHKAADFFRHVEHAFYIAVALALGLAGAILFGNVTWKFLTNLNGSRGVLHAILDFLDGMLLVFIFSELIHTVRAVIQENLLQTEPFLIIGIVAAIRRLIVITAQAEQQVGTPRFGNLMLEIGVLIASVLALGVTIFLIRHSRQGEPVPTYERELSH
jgi:uncharacterized membrane protein (DUF373 family)